MAATQIIHFEISMTLEPLHPDRGVTLYLSQRETEVTQETLQSHEYRLKHFVRWCDQEEIENLNSLTGRLLHEYRMWRREDGDLAPASEKTQMDTVRVFIRFMESIDAVEKDLHQSVQSPQLSKTDKSRNVHLKPEQAEAILNHVERFRYAQRYHIVYMLAWRCAFRTSAIWSLDLDDYLSRDQYLSVQNRPNEGTRLKQGEEGERMVALRDDTCRVLDDYIEHHRDDVTDDHGRDPLITTKQGRVAKNTIRGTMYKLTRPCVYAGECPHEEVDEDDCKATEQTYAYECPSSVSPHALRRSAISHWLSNDWPTRAVSDRANVSADVLEAHYDARDDKEKMEQRRGFLDNL